MDKDQLISRLNWFYSLELNQVDLYKSQSKSFADEYAGLVFRELSAIEQGHVENIGASIRKLGAEPTTIGDVISPVIGHIAGKIIGSRDLSEVLKVNTLIEQKAMKDYKKLIEDLTGSFFGNQALIEILQNNFIDENLHTEWFKTKLSELQTQEFSLIPYHQPVR
jgi:bacterioferritin